MLGRFETEEEGIALPVEWTEGLLSTLTHAYLDITEKQNRLFDVYGRIYQEEFVVIVSYMDATDPTITPITLFLSHDIIPDQKKLKNALDVLTNLIGLIFDDILGTDDWNDFVLDWTENPYEGNTFYYKISRENISLTIQANEILSGSYKINE